MLVALIALVAACGHPQTGHETEEREPAWAADYAQAATRACECKDDACIRAGRTELEATLAAHGGIEEAPPSIHESLAKFEACWLVTSRDLARDLGTSADTVCGCTETDCVGTWRDALWKLADKYGLGHPDLLRDAPGADTASTAAWDRGMACLATVTISSEDFLAILTTSNAELCGCTTPECAKAATDRSQATLDKYLVVSEDASLTHNIASAQLTRCKCGKKFPPTTEFEHEFTLGGMPLKIEGSLTMHWSCEG